MTVIFSLGIRIKVVYKVRKSCNQIPQQNPNKSFENLTEFLANEQTPWCRVFHEVTDTAI